MAGKMTLVTGGSRSGKSEFAEQLADKAAKPVTYLATGLPVDTEMGQRIDAHRQRRPQHWQTIEEPLEIAGVLGRLDRNGGLLLVDCLTTWIGNLLFSCHDHEHEEEGGYQEKVRRIAAETGSFLAGLQRISHDVIIVSGEVGMGPVPEYRLGRLFRDAVGEANQLLAREAQEVYLVVAGIPMKIK
ncbi:MAG: bifunctional adenosylcobinamide kinase/adenosylcobinamide-phosphate guanylyltransferase [Bacillota bacterium]